MRPRTDRHTDAGDHNTFCVVYDSQRLVIRATAATGGRLSQSRAEESVVDRTTTTAE